jgi:hypothetical protein
MTLFRQMNAVVLVVGRENPGDHGQSGEYDFRAACSYACSGCFDIGFVLGIVQSVSRIVERQYLQDHDLGSGWHRGIDPVQNLRRVFAADAGVCDRDVVAFCAEQSFELRWIGAA